MTPIDDASDELHQTWGLDRSAGCWRLDVFREPWEGDTWVCRRDPALRRPVAEAIEHTRDGIPYLAPELVLLFKAKHAREKDQADLARALPLLEPARRQWLGDALRLVHPGPRVDRTRRGRLTEKPEAGLEPTTHALQERCSTS